MKKAFFFLLFCGLNCCYAQDYRINSKTILRDTAGQVITKEIFWKFYMKESGTFGIQTMTDTIAKKVTEARLYRLSDAAIQKIMDADSVMNSQKKSVGTSAPPLEITDIYGNLFSLQQNAGKVIVLNFWFIACSPCQDEMPELKLLAEAHKDRNDVVFVSMARDGKNKLLKFVEKKAFGYSVAEITKSIIKNWSITGYPTNIVIDKTGKIVYESTGYGGNIRGLKRAVKKALSI